MTSFFLRLFPANWRPRVLLPLLTALLGLAPAQAKQVRPMDMDQLIAHAGLIFLGKVVSKTTNYGDITRFEVLETLKGGPLPKTYEVKQVKIAGSPAVSFRVGESVVVFLHAPSSLGFSSPVGYEQGKWAVHIKERLADSVIRPSAFQRAHVLTKLSPLQRSMLKLENTGAQANSQAFRLEDLKRLVDQKR